MADEFSMGSRAQAAQEKDQGHFVKSTLDSQEQTWYGGGVDGR